ncbi:YceI family protein [Streptomyces sp. NPDC057199]|uniref:YceI family protein n=1 Tax=Streptomyces sp. NPDC057199 TaxID=3346047 RepID=UPI003629E70C
MQRTSPLASVQTPKKAGALSGRMLDPVKEPVSHAEFVVSDEMGRNVVSGRTDPFGTIVTTVPAGRYHVAVSAEGYIPHRVTVTVEESALASLGEVTLQLARLPKLPGPGDWEIDPTHSSIAFTARHIALARIHGRFNSFAGTVRIADPVERSAMHVLIDAASVDTNFRMRDDYVRSADFLDVDRFPTLEFYSERFVHKGGTRWAVTGALSLHGVTRTVTLDVEYLGIGTGMQGEARAACLARTELHRDDFTVSWQKMLARGIMAVGQTIAVELDVQIVPHN